MKAKMLNIRSGQAIPRPIAPALLLMAAAVIVLAGWRHLSHSINQEKGKHTSIPVASVCLSLPDPSPTPFSAPVESVRPTYDPAIPLPPDLQEVLYAACEEDGVPVALVLGVIQVESCFDINAVSDMGCYGLMQLNPKYFPEDLSPADNLRAGVAWLACLMGQYEDTGAALTAYNAGYDTGSRVYAQKVLDATGAWENW